MRIRFTMRGLNPLRQFGFAACPAPVATAGSPAANAAPLHRNSLLFTLDPPCYAKHIVFIGQLRMTREYCIKIQEARTRKRQQPAISATFHEGASIRAYKRGTKSRAFRSSPTAKSNFRCVYFRNVRLLSDGALRKERAARQKTHGPFHFAAEEAKWRIVALQPSPHLPTAIHPSFQPQPNHVNHASFYSCLYATHQRNRAVLLLVVEEERTVRKPADKVTAPVLLDCSITLFFLTRTLYQKLGYSINFSRVERSAHKAQGVKAPTALRGGACRQEPSSGR